MPVDQSLANSQQNTMSNHHAWWDLQQAFPANWPVEVEEAGAGDLLSSQDSDILASKESTLKCPL